MAAPTLETIRERAVLVQTTWTATEEQHRRMGRREVPLEVERAVRATDHMVRREGKHE